MKLIRFSFLVFLLSMMMIACGDDSTTDPDGEVDAPNGVVTLITTIDGEEKERLTVERKGDVLTPSSYNLSGYYVNANGLFNIMLSGDTDVDNNFSVGLFAVLSELKAGTYNYTDFDDQNSGGYRNSKFGTDSYSASSITLVITKVQYIALSEFGGNYYITGTLNMELENEYNENPNVNVKLEFENMEIIKGITGF
ncbi:MAG: hypothetical protein WC121_05850 [Candidatus Kapaibacterium sp.]